ncbi:MAG: efflux RND transporter permease subunit [Planctomycetaceae bacterium]
MQIENSLNGIPHLDTVRSKSVLGLSSVRLIFQRGTDLLLARQLVQERLALATPRLPAVTKPPVILPPLSSLSRAMKIGLQSEKLSQMDLTVLSKWTIRPRLMSIRELPMSRSGVITTDSFRFWLSDWSAGTRADGQ